VATKLRRICIPDVVERMEVCQIPFFVKGKRVSTIYKLLMLEHTLSKLECCLPSERESALTRSFETRKLRAC
jgi:hypothetical protein